MIETNGETKHIAGIIPIAGEPIGYDMPWHDCLMPIHNNYHAVERAINTAALAGCNTIWLVMNRETQPIIRKKVGEWIYDPKYIWLPPNPFKKKREVPIYYVCINPRDRKRRDSNAWSVLYGANVASYISKKISKWALPKKFFVVPPYGVISDEAIKKTRDLIAGDNNVLFTQNNQTFQDNVFLPFTFTQKEYEICRLKFRDDYIGKDTNKTYNDIFGTIDTSQYIKITPDWFYDISKWDDYSTFIGSVHNKLCERPKYMVTHTWYGLVKDK